MTEREPDTDNVVYLDEYPDLHKKVWLQRLNAQRQSGKVITPKVVEFPSNPDPDDAA